MLGSIVMRIVLIVLVLFILAVLVSSIKFVQQSQAYVITRLGVFHTVWGRGPTSWSPSLKRWPKGCP